MAKSSTSLLSFSTTIEMYENWFHYGLFVHEPLQTSVRNILHNISNDPSYDGLPVNPEELYLVLYNNHKHTLDSLQNKGIINRYQMMLLLPYDIKRTCSENMNIPLLVVLIRNCTNLCPPIHGKWYGTINPLDQSKAANVLRAISLTHFLATTQKSLINTHLMLSGRKGTML